MTALLYKFMQICQNGPLCFMHYHTIKVIVVCPCICSSVTEVSGNHLTSRQKKAVSLAVELQTLETGSLCEPQSRH